MKKSILVLTIIVTGLILTSCLGENDTEYSGAPLSYIERSEAGVVYARTLERSLDGGLLSITSPEIKMLQPGSFVFIAYSWKENQNTVTEEGLLNVTISQISDPLEQTVLIASDAPELETEFPLSFNPADKNDIPLYLGAYFGYHWMSSYGYEKGDGNRKEIRFFHNFDEGDENEVIIDVRLVNVGGTVDKDQSGIPILVNLKQLNDYYAADMTPSETRKNIKVHFRYYRKLSDGTTELFKTQLPFNMTITKE